MNLRWQFLCMPKKIINTSKAPAPIGPYNQSVKAGNFLFVSGQIAIDPATNQPVNGDIQTEVQQVMKNIEAIFARSQTYF